MNWIKQINNKVEERWINSSYEFKYNLSEIFFLGIFAVWLILTYSWTTMAHIPWPPFFLFLRSDRDWTCSIVPVYGDENLRYKENTIYTSGYWIIYNCEKIFRS